MLRMGIWLLVKCKEIISLVVQNYILQTFCLIFTKYFYCLLLCDNLGNLSQNS